MESRGWRAHAPLVAVLLLLAAGVRLYRLGQLSLWYDEVIHVEYCSKLPIGVFTGKVELVEPFFALLLYAWQRIGTSDTWLRMHSVLFGIATAALGYAMGNRTGGRRMGAFAALLLALGPFLVFYSRDAKEYAMLAFLELAAAHLAIRFGSSDGRLSHLALYVLTATLAIYSHNAVPFFLAALNLMFFACYMREFRKAIGWALAQGALITLAAPWFAAQYRFAQAMENKMFWAPVPTMRSLYVSFANMFAGYVVHDWLRIAGVVLLAGLLLAGFVFGGSSRRIVFFLGLTAVGQAVGLYLFSKYGGTSYFVDRFLVGNSALLLTAVGMSAAALPRAGLRYAAVGASVALMSVSLHDLYHNRLDENGLNHVGVYRTYDGRGMAAAIRRDWRPGDVVWHTWRQIFSPMRWYGREQRHIIIDMSQRIKVAESYRAAASAEDIGAEPVEVENAIQGVRRIWFVVPGDAGDLGAIYKGIYAWLAARCGPPAVFRFGGEDDIHAPSSLFLFDLETAGMPDTHPTADSTHQVEVSRIVATLTAPEKTGGEASATFINEDKKPQRIHYEAYVADAVCRAQNFDRALAQDSRWRVQPYRDRDKARLAMHTRVDANSHPADLISQTFILAGGRYGVFVERLMTGDIYPSPTADFVIRVEDAEFRVPGTGDKLRGGWMWRRAGQWENDAGGESVVSVTAEDPGNRPEALGTISTVAFVREEPEAPIRDTPVIAQGSLVALPGKTETIRIPTLPGMSRLYCVVALPRDCAVAAVALPMPCE